MRTKSLVVGSESATLFIRRCFLAICVITALSVLFAVWGENGGACAASVSDMQDSVVTSDDLQATSQSYGTNVGKTFVQKIRRSFEKTFIVDGRWRLFRDGVYVTLAITFFSIILGTVFAFLQCCMRRSHCWWLRYTAKAYITIMQGTPILVVLLIMYYVVFAKFNAPWGYEKETVAVIAMSLNFAAYAGEMMRTGVDGIDKGLVEAARALGFGRVQVFTKVIMPIATRRIIPVYKGESISLLKTTSIVGYIATQDLTKASDIVRARTYEAFFPLIATALIYLVFAMFLTLVFLCIEHYLDPVNRRKRAKGEVNE